MPRHTNPHEKFCLELQKLWKLQGPSGQPISEPLGLIGSEQEFRPAEGRGMSKPTPSPVSPLPLASWVFLA